VKIKYSVDVRNKNTGLLVRSEGGFESLEAAEIAAKDLQSSYPENSIYYVETGTYRE
jgi:hypothetical protein